MREKAMVNENPLVSIAVVTYNSAATVIETLDSIKDQTYQNLELIVSDDCSTDNTVDVCRKWIESNQDRFMRTELVASCKNTGVSANVNRAGDACRGEWVKMIAGDDMLISGCIETYISYVNEHPDSRVVFSRVRCFGDYEDGLRQMKDFFLYEFFDWDIKEQLEFLSIERNCIPAGTYFYNNQWRNKLGVRCDERIPLLDDWPLWISLLRKGVRFSFIDEELVLYRLSVCSLCTGPVHKESYQKSYAAVYVYYQFWTYLKKHGCRKAISHYLNSRIMMGKNLLFWRNCQKFLRLFA